MVEVRGAPEFVELEVRERLDADAPVLFEVAVSTSALGPTLSLLAQAGGVPLTTQPRGAAVVVTGDVPADQVHRLTLMLPDVTRGDGVLTSRLDHFRPQG